MTAPIDLEALRAALAAGPTPGPWNVGRFGTIHAGEHHSYVNGTAQEQLISVHPLMRSSADDPYEERKITTAYIAACDPTTIGALVAELTTRRARDAEVAALVAACRLARSYMSEAIEYETPCAKRDGATVDAALAPFTGAKP